MQTGQVIQFIILENDRPIGSVNMKDVDYEKGTAEYGIFIGEKDALGKGYGSETAKQVVRLAKEKYHLKKLFLRLYEDNIPAYRSYSRTISPNSRSLTSSSHSGSVRIITQRF